MIRLITGTIANITKNGVIVTTGGLGYLVHTTSKSNLLPNDEVTLHTYLAVRETALDLYGFTTDEELSLFELLLTIPKIGPKSAMQILDQADIHLIVESVKLQDFNNLSKLSGMGKKTAEKVVLALKDKLDTISLLSTSTSGTVSDIYQDAFDTLITLGYNPVNIKQVLDSLPEQTSTSTMVKNALRLLS